MTTDQEINLLLTRSYAAQGPSESLLPFDINRRAIGTKDVLIKILYCGVCHSDIHQMKNEWGNSTYPMVPGHEIIGKVIQLGKHVTKFNINDIVGVGCFVDSCRICESCQEGEEQYCETHLSATYNGTEQDRKTPTYGGYSSQIVVDENYILRIPNNLPLANVAPLLCAGITTYSPLQKYKIGPSHKVAIVGLGGLGHMAVKFAVAMGAQVTVLSSSALKKSDAYHLGAKQFFSTEKKENLVKLKNYFNFIVMTISAQSDINMYLNLLHKDGTMIVVGAPENGLTINPFSLILGRRKIVGSHIGSISETQEMLDYCAEHNIVSDIEIIPIQKISEAFERIIQGNVRFRFVIDMNTLDGV